MTSVDARSIVDALQSAEFYANAEPNELTTRLQHELGPVSHGPEGFRNWSLEAAALDEDRVCIGPATDEAGSMTSHVEDVRWLDSMAKISGHEIRPEVQPDGYVRVVVGGSGASPERPMCIRNHWSSLLCLNASIKRRARRFHILRLPGGQSFAVALSEEEQLTVETALAWNFEVPSEHWRLARLEPFLTAARRIGFFTEVGGPSTLGEPWAKLADHQVLEAVSRWEVPDVTSERGRLEVLAQDTSRSYQFDTECAYEGAYGHALRSLARISRRKLSVGEVIESWDSAAGTVQIRADINGVPLTLVAVIAGDWFDSSIVEQLNSVTDLDGTQFHRVWTSDQNAFFVALNDEEAAILQGMGVRMAVRDKERHPEKPKAPPLDKWESMGRQLAEELRGHRGPAARIEAARFLTFLEPFVAQGHVKAMSCHYSALLGSALALQLEGEDARFMFFRVAEETSKRPGSVTDMAIACQAWTGLALTDRRFAQRHLVKAEQARAQASNMQAIDENSDLNLSLINETMVFESYLTATTLLVESVVPSMKRSEERNAIVVAQMLSELRASHGSPMRLS